MKMNSKEELKSVLAHNRQLGQTSEMMKLAAQMGGVVIVSTAENARNLIKLYGYKNVIGLGQLDSLRGNASVPIFVDNSAILCL